MRVAILIATVALSSCASAPRLPNSQTASEQYSTLGYHEKFIARNFYDLGSGDAIKRLYWAQRNEGQYRARDGAEGSSAVSLQRRYATVPVPEHVDPDGTIKEASNVVVETVNMWAPAMKP